MTPAPYRKSWRLANGFSWKDHAIAQAYARRRQGRVLARERLLAAKEVGKAVGLVVIPTVTHATPASFAISNPDRNPKKRKE